MEDSLRNKGPCIGHVSPEAMSDGPIGAIEDGDIIEIDIEKQIYKCGII